MSDDPDLAAAILQAAVEQIGGAVRTGQVEMAQAESGRAHV